jgi:hypothetical protein
MLFDSSERQESFSAVDEGLGEAEAQEGDIAVVDVILDLTTTNGPASNDRMLNLTKDKVILTLIESQYRMSWQLKRRFSGLTKAVQLIGRTRANYGLKAVTTALQGRKRCRNALGAMKPRSFLYTAFVGWNCAGCESLLRDRYSKYWYVSAALRSPSYG